MALHVLHTFPSSPGVVELDLPREVFDPAGHLLMSIQAVLGDDSPSSETNALLRMHESLRGKTSLPVYTWTGLLTLHALPSYDLFIGYPRLTAIQPVNGELWLQSCSRVMMPFVHQLSPQTGARKLACNHYYKLVRAGAAVVSELAPYVGITPAEAAAAEPLQLWVSYVTQAETAQCETYNPVTGHFGALPFGCYYGLGYADVAPKAAQRPVVATPEVRAAAA